MTIKNCSDCGIEFQPYTSNQRRCPSCVKKQGGKYKGHAGEQECKECGKKFIRKAPRQIYCSKECGSIRKYHLKRKYDLTLSEEKEIKELYGTDCMICGCATSQGSMKRNNLCIDHDHKTGKVRGILCHHCNCALGMFKDETGLLQRAIDYLFSSKERATTIENLKKKRDE